MASSILLSDADADTATRQRSRWVRSLLRETLRQRRALRLVQTSPMHAYRSGRPGMCPGPGMPSQQQRYAACNYVAVRVAVARFANLMSTSTTADSRDCALAMPAPPPVLPVPVTTKGTTTTISTDGVAGVRTPSVQKSVCPEEYLLHLLRKRGRTADKVSSAQAGYDMPPTSRQVQNYESKPFMTDFVRRGEMGGLQEALEAGRGMDASNKFGESLVHVACRRGNMDVLRFLLKHGGSLTCCDDLGRFPLHEVCWAVEPRFDIVRLFLEHQQRHDEDQRAGEDSAESGSASSVLSRSSSSHRHSRAESMTTAAASGSPLTTGVSSLNPNLLLVTDRRGCTPLRYVQEHSWPLWCAFLDEVADEFWPAIVPADDHVWP